MYSTHVCRRVDPLARCLPDSAGSGAGAAVPAQPEYHPPRSQGMYATTTTKNASGIQHVGALYTHWY